jgi:hypothetical protein
MQEHNPLDFHGHTLITGVTGTGKSGLVVHLATRAMSDPQRAVILFDSHSPAVHALLALVPEGRIKDVVLLDFIEPEWVIGWNPLDVTLQLDDDARVTAIVSAMQDTWPIEELRLDPVPLLRMILRVLLETNHFVASSVLLGPSFQFSLLDIGPLITSARLRRTLFSFPHSPELIAQFHPFLEQSANDATDPLAPLAPIARWIESLSVWPAARRILGTSHNSLDFDALLREHRILLVRLPPDPTTAALLSSLLLYFATAAVQRLPKIADAETSPVVSIFEDGPAAPAFPYSDALPELAKHGAELTLATARLPTFPDAERLVNLVENCALLRLASSDAEWLVPKIGPLVSPNKLGRLAPGHGVVLTRPTRAHQLALLHTMVEFTTPPPLPEELRIRNLVLQHHLRRAVPGATADRHRQAHLLRHGLARPAGRERLWAWLERVGWKGRSRIARLHRRS